ncbi:B12 binding domain-containing protein [Micromonospora phaseoli]|uniref:B12 binding domain-containing protein n=1 Tax=Micromonospora phaseoli TaxID=1144548 RepID=A0A1H7BL92_9ACTN|nr:MerR family transcriptional regulator [Micromonospora phaseoli]PZV94877.1 B12 binding protein [Micromonospora phaseoli]GIJ79721.1 transcriptional regulator [Micromonospora phaseoli]SEJ78369.1 B12 binding domain-containing protein [Micromonospora phaseoli]
MADEALSAGAVARRLGVAVTTLRTWHQRYGLGPSQHVPGHHRRYSPADLARLEIMRRLTAEGVSPADAARWARQAPDTLPTDRDSRTRPRARDGGGNTIPVGRAGPAARGLARAAMRLDGAAISETISRAIAADGVVGTWDRLLRPVLAGIGDRHAATGVLIEVEHLVSRCVSAAFTLVATARPAGGSPRVLLSCTDEEQHSLPLEALAAALAEAGVGYRMLGARVPVAALLAAVERTGPAAVVLWSHTRATADPSQLTALLTAPQRPLLVLAAGPGWRTDTLPAGVVRPADLSEAVSLAIAVQHSADRPAAS